MAARSSISAMSAACPQWARRFLARIIHGNPMAIEPGYARLLRELKRRRAAHLPTRDLLAKQRDIVHRALGAGR